MEKITMNLIKISLSLAVVSAFQGCKSYGDCSCTNVQKFSSNVGTINIPQLVIGDVVILDTITKTAQTKTNIFIPEKLKSIGTPVDTTMILSTATLDVALSGSIAKASASIQAQAKTDILQNTVFFMKNSISKTIRPTDSLMNLPNILTSLKKVLQNNQHAVIFFVSKVIYADNFNFQIKSSTSTDANANIVHTGNFDVNVSYSCQGSLRLNSKSGGLLFKGSYWGLTNDGNSLVLKTYKINISDYSFVLATE